MASLRLLSNASATGSAFGWLGGKGLFSVVGTFGGATVTLQMLAADGSTYVSLGSAVAITAAGVGVFEAPPCTIRALVAGGPPSGIYAEVAEI